MVRYSLGFFVLAIVAMVFGLYGIAGISVEIGKMLLYTFLGLAVLAFLGGLLGGRRTQKQIP